MADIFGTELKVTKSNAIQKYKEIQKDLQEIYSADRLPDVKNSQIVAANAQLRLLEEMFEITEEDV